MEIIWHLFLTTCLGSICVEQDIRWFKTNEECNKELVEYIKIPTDGDWDSIEYICKPVGSRGT